MDAAGVDRLLAAADDAGRNAYAPYSNFAVGAALLTAGGQVVSGCNVENASYGLTICAERVAVSSAAAQGLRAFEALLVRRTPGGPLLVPCGACLQVLAEFSPGLVLVTGVQPTVLTPLQDLLSQPFRLSGGPKPDPAADAGKE